MKVFSCLDEEADDCDVIRLCHCISSYINEGGLYKEECMGPGALLWSLVVDLFGSTSFVGSHRPSVSATLVPLKEWDYNHTGKCFFICLTVCAQGYPEHLELVCFSCL